MRRLSTLLLFAVCALLFGVSARAQIEVVGDGGPGPATAQHLRVALIAPSSSVAPGGTLQVGLQFRLDDHWHVYWVNAGDSGEPPKITWALPKDITAGPMQFPIPTRLPLGPLMDFGYENGVVFPIKFVASPYARPGPVHLDAKIDWLVCREVCIPGKAHLGLNLNVVRGTVPVAPTGDLAQALSLIPGPPPSNAQFSVMGGRQNFVLTLITGTRETNAEFYPLDQEQIANAAPQAVEPLPNGVRLRVSRAPELVKLPAELHGIIKLSAARAYDVTAPVVPGEVPVAAAVKSSSAAPWSAIVLAFLGGIILNLMPCVFPVLFLKGLALVQSSGEERSRLRRHGLIYTLGILVSFWTIVAVLLALRSGGSQAGWGFQLQSPTFVALLASGIFFFALSLAGQFEIGLSLTSVGGDLAKKPGYTGSFFTGVLATIVATPCTAPLMGAAIGFALAQSVEVTFAVFTALALGLATPYLLLSFQPAWTRLLPRPGSWMETLKHLTAVPLFGTAIWLSWVYGYLYSGEGGVGVPGVDHTVHLLWCFLGLAIAGWVLGKWPARWKSAIAAVIIGAIALAIPLYQPKDTTLVWQPYSQQALDQARSAGRPVFIDFTAAWCLSCQVNERLVLKSTEVQHEFRKGNVTLLKADWTHYDPEITKELASIGRSGVPTYVIYPARKDDPADVLPELLTKQIVLDALKRDLHP
ncbi:protein-disulfide reductase DsbD family protein [Edaphobacter sp.]|uniref:protein-disulfide reductase DsbD family protein n=1 Tax=Edaphobacter sp. TaxID=1934404 RepID=UPI002DBA0351|nr:thioredoxin family protein [Edaphobacter sp.]HEU5340457.1 thioredoxin family protein [Edaphobacter sp.]